ncbi:MAG: TetR/AcrR family transcriptional regulator [Reyranellaceae bacterium]
MIKFPGKTRSGGRIAPAPAAKPKLRGKVQRVPNTVRRSTSLAAIRRAARELFVEKGYSITTIDDIARRCELSKGAIYFYFTDKADILCVLLDEAERQIYDPVFERLAAARTWSAMEKLALYVNWVSRMGAEAPDLFLLPILISIELKGRNDRVGKVIRKIYRRIETTLTDIIKSGQQSGLIHQDAPARELAGILIATTDGAFLEYLRRGGSLDGPKFVIGIRRMVLQGFAR